MFERSRQAKAGVTEMVTHTALGASIGVQGGVTYISDL